MRPRSYQWFDSLGAAIKRQSASANEKCLMG